MSDELPNLQEIARRTLWIEGVGLSEQAITDALVEAGMNPEDQNERERFFRLVKANFHHQYGEIEAILGPYFEQAADDVGRDAPQEVILRRAFEIAQHDKPSTSADLRRNHEKKTNPG